MPVFLQVPALNCEAFEPYTKEKIMSSKKKMKKTLIYFFFFDKLPVPFYSRRSLVDFLMERERKENQDSFGILLEF